MGKAIVYTTTTCAYCTVVKRFLDSKHVEYEVRNAEEPEHGDAAFKLSGALTVPVTVINEKVIVGWNPSQLSAALGA